MEEILDKPINKYGIYIHVPVCKGKCIYCSFYSVGHAHNFDWKAFVDAVLAELYNRQTEIEGKELSTIYIGGGTPSLMPPLELRRLIDSIKGTCNKHYETIKEVTLEVNPDDVSSELAAEWKDAGINRISMGVQSLNDQELKFIGRRHSAAEAIEAYEILRCHFSNISLDLIFGLPGQTLESLKETLLIFTELRPEHISAYSLMYEERSAIIKMLERGSVAETPEEISVDMFRLINSTLSQAGYNRYEISNYSLPGYKSIHNSSYWESIPYIGLGPSAHSYDGDFLRRFNKPDIRDYLNPEHIGNPSKEYEYLSEDELFEETLMTRLRVSSGLNLEALKNRFGDDKYIQLMQNAQKHIDNGNLIIYDGNLKLTDEGVMISDEILIDLF